MNAKAQATLSMNRRAAQRALKLATSEIAAHHNWIASAIERGQTKYATWLVKELREHEELSSSIRGAYKEAWGVYPEEDHAAKPKWFAEETGENPNGTPA